MRIINIKTYNIYVLQTSQRKGWMDGCHVVNICMYVFFTFLTSISNNKINEIPSISLFQKLKTLEKM